MAINNSLTCIANDLRLLMLIKNENRLKIDVNQNHKSPSAD